MRLFPLIFAAGMGMTAPVMAQDFDDVIGGIAQGLIQQELDRAAFVAAQQTNTAAAYRGYLAKYPRGLFRTAAQSALDRLGAPVDGPAASAAEAEARLGITVSQRMSVQRELTRLGYNTYGADGAWGRNTRSAIGSWQRDRRDPVTGYVTDAQLRVLLRGTEATPPPTDTPPAGQSGAQTEAALRLTRTQRTEIQRQLTAIGYDAGVADGLWGSRTRSALTAWQRANRQTATGYVTSTQVRLIASQAGTTTPTPAPGGEDAAELEESLLELTVTERADLQRRLTRLGYSTSRTDGTFGAGTRRAISDWQADKREPVTGYLTADQVRLIRVETGG